MLEFHTIGFMRFVFRAHFHFYLLEACATSLWNDLMITVYYKLIIGKGSNYIKTEYTVVLL